MNYNNLDTRLPTRSDVSRDFLSRIARVRAASLRARTHAEKKALFTPANARP